MIHVFDRRHAAEAKRGRPLITPVIPSLKGVKSLSNAMLNHAHTQALIVATIKSTLAARDIFESDFGPSQQGGGDASPYTKYMQDSAEWTDRTNLYWRDNKIIKLFPHEELDTKAPGTPFAAYDAFEQTYHSENARGLGMDMSSYTGRFDRSSYSTSRMILMREWRRYMTVRKMIHSNFAGAVYCAWLEEQLENGRVPFPRGVRERLTTRNRRHNFFIANKDALCGSMWYGPPREDADPAKGAVARRLNRELRLETLTSQLAERGRNLDEVVEEIIDENLFQTDAYEDAGLQLPGGLDNIPHEIVAAAFSDD
jgi:capsid protein